MDETEPYIAQLYDPSVFVATVNSLSDPEYFMLDGQALQQAQADMFALRKQLAEARTELFQSQTNPRIAQETVANASEVIHCIAFDAVLPGLPTIPLPTSHLPVITLPGTKIPIATKQVFGRRFPQAN